MKRERVRSGLVFYVEKLPGAARQQYFCWNAARPRRPPPHTRGREAITNCILTTAQHNKAFRDKFLKIANIRDIEEEQLQIQQQTAAATVDAAKAAQASAEEARRANELAAEANQLAGQASKKSGRATVVAVVSFATALISLATALIRSCDGK